MDQPLFRVRNVSHIFYGVIQRISEDGANICHMKKGEQFSVCHTGHSNIVLFTEKHLSGQNCIQNSVSCMNRDVVLLDLLFQGVQPLASLVGILHVPQGVYLVFQIVVSDVDEFYAFLIIAVVVILILKQGVDMGQFFSDMNLSHVSLVSVQDRKTAQIHQSTDVKNILNNISAEGRTGDHEAEVTEQKSQNTYNNNDNNLTYGLLLSGISLMNDFFQTISGKKMSP